MRTRDAVALIAPAFRQSQSPGAWLDLGCGDGTFTRALAELLPPGSSIEAVDRDVGALRRIPPVHATIPIHTTAGDFAALPLPWRDIAGVLMANALHFVAGQERFLTALATALVPHGRIIVVEYDTDEAREPWVPHPVSARTLERLAGAAGLTRPDELGRRRSQFGGEMFAAQLLKAAHG